jgi:hypothetical protein
VKFVSRLLISCLIVLFVCYYADLSGCETTHAVHCHDVPTYERGEFDARRDRPRSAAANTGNGLQAIHPLPLSPRRVQSAPDLVMPRSPTPLDYMARTRELDAMMAEVFNRISELEVQMYQIQAQVPFIRESGINSDVRVISTRDRISQLEPSVSHALRRGSGIPEAELSGGIHRSGDAPPIGQKEPSDLGEDAPRSSKARS